MPAQVSDRGQAVEIRVPRPPHAHPPNRTSCSVILQVLGGTRAHGRVGKEVSAPTGRSPSSLLSSLFPQPVLGAFYHIKMFGLMGLTRLRGGMKKGPLFPRLLRCTLTYFWRQWPTMEVTGVDRGGRDGGRSQLPLMCVRNVQSNLGGGREALSGQATGTTL